jgi:hypothetical protein
MRIDVPLCVDDDDMGDAKQMRSQLTWVHAFPNIRTSEHPNIRVSDPDEPILQHVSPKRRRHK